MNEPKPFASLSSGLLARKGSAKPAMRPQSYRFANEGNSLAVASPSLDDLGWNDMGDDVAAEAASAPVALHGAPVARLVIPPRVVVQQEELAQRLETPSNEAEIVSSPVETAEETVAVSTAFDADSGGHAPLSNVTSVDRAVEGSLAARASTGAKPKAAFTLRLDPDRHLRLRLVCAVTHRSAQQIVTQALDEFLARQPENSRLASLG
jgi:hypothetical protein